MPCYINCFPLTAAGVARNNHLFLLSVPALFEAHCLSERNETVRTSRVVGVRSGALRSAESHSQIAQSETESRRS